MREPYNQIEETVFPTDVDLTTFVLQDSLNRKFWGTDGKRINQEYRRNLLKIAKDFLIKMEIDWVVPKDIIVSGSIANFNWSRDYSDVDLHIILDYDSVMDKEAFVTRYFKYAKDVWNSDHDGIRLGGFPVEVYVQDSKEKLKSNGIYSILYDKWISFPSKKQMNYGNFDEDSVSEYAAEFMNRIDELEFRYEQVRYREKSPMRLKIDKFKQIYEDAKNLLEEIKTFRRKNQNVEEFEMSSSNLTFKVLRRNGYIEKLENLKKSTYDSMMSIP